MAELEKYIQLLNFYAEALGEPAEPKGRRFELLFERIVRLLNQPTPFNAALPAPFLDVARRYGAGEPATVRHFRYDENRQFFLGDLYDYLQLLRMRSNSGGA